MSSNINLSLETPPFDTPVPVSGQETFSQAQRAIQAAEKIGEMEIIKLEMREQSHEEALTAFGEHQRQMVDLRGMNEVRESDGREPENRPPSVI